MNKYVLESHRNHREEAMRADHLPSLRGRNVSRTRRSDFPSFSHGKRKPCTYDLSSQSLTPSCWGYVCVYHIHHIIFQYVLQKFSLSSVDTRPTTTSPSLVENARNLPLSRLFTRELFLPLNRSDLRTFILSHLLLLLLHLFFLSIFFNVFTK